MTPIHSASLVSPDLHSKATLQLLDLDISNNLIDYIVQCTVDTVDFALNRSSTSTGSSTGHTKMLSRFKEFASNVIHRSEVRLPILLTTLVYISRAKLDLCIQTEEWAHERVFLGAVIVAAKYTNDSSLKNDHWSLCTGIFGRRDVGRIEREFLAVLDWNLSVSESDILSHHDAVMALYPAPLSSHTSLPHRHMTNTDSHWSDSDSDSSSSPASSPETPSTLAAPQIYHSSHIKAHIKWPTSSSSDDDADFHAQQHPRRNNSSLRPKAKRFTEMLQRSIPVPWGGRFYPSS